ncbi:MAG: 30S ribosome-binding factor RbfA [Clostridia bacterium]
MPNVRYDRMAEEIKKVMSEIVREMKDPRITIMTTIMNVDVTNDLKWAKVRVSVYDKSDKVREEAVVALNNASGFIAREIGRRMDIRSLPKFKFELDNSIEYSVHISKLIDELNKPRKQD